jgi:flagellar basal-body rod protein FlgF
MENVAYIALSRMTAMRRQMDVIANNVANMSTPAFKGEQVLFAEYLVRTQPRDKSSADLSFVQDLGTWRELRDGEKRRTGEPFDVAIDGPGYFAVETPRGLRYTRNGHFRLNDQGALVTAAGHAVLDENGRSIALTDEGGGSPSIAKDGTVSSGTGAALGRLQVVTFANELALKAEGDSLYAAIEPPQPVANAKVDQGMIEDSNVRPIVEMANMIELQRNFEATQRLLEADHDRRRKAIDRLARIA